MPDRKIEQDVENLNKAEASKYTHLFTRSCTVLGYAVYLTLATCSVLALASIPNVASNFYPNNLPKINDFKEYFLYYGSAMLACGLGWSVMCYDNWVIGLGRTNLNLGIHFVKSFSAFAFIVIILIIARVVLAEFINAIALEFILMTLVTIAFFAFLFFWNVIVAYLEPTEEEKIAKKTSSKTSIFRVAFFSVIGVIVMFYMYALVNIYRVADTTWRFVIVLVIHPLFAEFYLTYVRMTLRLPREHPFFLHGVPMILETSLNLFRRFLFNDTTNTSLILYFTLICGLQEIISRNFMVAKERFLAKLIGKELLKDDVTILRTRKYYGYCVTARSIEEISSIIIAPFMLMCFQNNRYAVDLGYIGENSIDGLALFTGTLIQLIVELFVIYACSILEASNNIPMSDFFFHFRSPLIFVYHWLFLLFSSFWVLHSFRTSPNLLVCSDVKDPCSCPSFTIYQKKCILLQNSTSTVSAVNLQSSTFAAFFNNTSSIVLFVLGLFGVFGLSLFLYYLNKSRKISKSLKKQSEKIQSFILDKATSSMIEKSSLQSAIAAIESLCRGVSPSQALVLKKIINVLKEQNNIDIDVHEFLRDSSDDQMIVKWLNDQLGTHEDKRLKGERRKSLTIKKFDYKRVRNSIFSRDQVGIFNNKEDFRNEKLDDTLLTEPKVNVVNVMNEQNFFQIEGFSPSNDYISWDFNVFSIQSKNPQAWFAYKCLSNIGIIDELELRKKQLSNMLLYVEQHYSLVNYDTFSAYCELDDSVSANLSTRNILPSNINKEEVANTGNQYHNNYHGADVFQAVLYFCTSYKDIGGNFTSYDLFSVLFAAYIHDFNHPGLNSTYVISDWPNSGISSTFGTDSPLERHHLAMAFNLMRNKNQFNFMVHFSSNKLDYFRKIVTECVLITDLAKSMPWILSFRNNNGLKENIQVSVPADEKLKIENEKKEMEIKILKMQLAIKCADVGHPYRKLDQHLEWSSRICAEFYSQGDKERDKGMQISALCDRNVPMSNYPQSQIGFINFVCKPCFTLLNEVCISVGDDQKPWLKYMKENVEYWEEKKKIMMASL